MTSSDTDASPELDASDDCTTVQVARRLGLAVRSVQLMVDRGELQAWKTPGGHRRISRASVEQWLLARQRGDGSGPVPEGAGPHRAGYAAHRPMSRSMPPAPQAAAVSDAATAPTAAARQARVLLIEDSRHFQNLIGLLLKSRFPQVDLHLADDGIAGLALAGRLEPEVLLVDILLPGIDGATLITSLRTQAAFARSKLIVITSLEGEALAPYAFALEGLPVVHKPRLAVELPGLLAAVLAGTAPS